MILLDQMGHLVSDKSLDELHDFAAKIGMKREWFQDTGTQHPHYDVMGVMKSKAVRHGAKLVDSRELVKRALKKGRDL